jgi:hypothetical protein
LQDHNADILFDDDGYALEGSTYFSLLNDKNKRVLRNYLMVVSTHIANGSADFQLDATQNANGYFNIDTRTGKIHFSLIMQVE